MTTDTELRELLAAATPGTLLAKTLGRVKIVDECWEWTGARCQGYGQVWWEGRVRRVHRVVYRHVVGEIPAGLVLDHLCRNRSCCKPAHLEAVTVGVNTERGLAASRLRNDDLCRNGLHPWPESAFLDNSNGRLTCRLCRNERAKQHMRRARAKAKAASIGGAA